ncbi:STAS domain-containing protein [candidate division KSB1 bacterium]|nr:STAS domain-containing protein [candidate division KSB1 bacterium]
MNFLLEEVQDIAVLRLKEQRLDSMIAPDLKAQLLVLLNNEKRNKIIVDLSQVGYADSSGLGALLFGLRQSREMGTVFILFGAQKRVLTLLQIAHLGDVLVNYPSEADAMQAMHKK